MSLFPAYFGARKRADEDPAPVTEPENETRADIFNLIPPRASDKYERPDKPEKPATSEKIEAPEKVEGRNVHAVSAMDLSRLSIDNDDRLYWDGKPVEVRRRLMMSRPGGGRERHRVLHPGCGDRLGDPGHCDLERLGVPHRLDKPMRDSCPRRAGAEATPRHSGLTTATRSVAKQLASVRHRR